MENSAFIHITMLVGGLTAVDVQPATPAQPTTPVPPSITAAQALRALGRMTSIGPDPCRRRMDDEIVVCGRIKDIYAVPLYSVDLQASRRDGPGTAAGALIAGARTFAPCRARGEPCAAPLPVVTIGFGPGKKRGPQIGEDRTDGR